MFRAVLINKAKRLLSRCHKQDIMLATAESCTGGLVAALLTEIPGSSEVFERGFITYSNASKHALLGVSSTMLESHGAVSAEVATAMAEGALARSHAQLSIA